MNHLLKLHELATLLGVPVSFVYDRTRLNSPDPIPHFKLGKYVRFDLAQSKSGWQSVRDEHEIVDRCQPLGIYMAS